MVFKQEKISIICSSFSFLAVTMSFSTDEDDFLNCAYDEYEADLGRYDWSLVESQNQQGGALSIDDSVNITAAGYHRSKKYACQFRRFKVSLKDLENVAPKLIPFYIHRILEKVITDVGSSAADHHLMRVCRFQES